MKKVVGIMPLYDEEKESYWMLPGYMKMLEREAVVPLMLPLTEDKNILDYFLENCQGFVLTGGQDVSPKFYKAELSKRCGVVCEMRDQMEEYILKEAVKRDRSVLGICRGIQFINACFGGDLYQDLETEYKSKVNHHMRPPYNRVVHEVNILKDTPLFDILEKEKIGVNSYHHQAIKSLSPQLRKMAVSEDGLVEAVYMPGKRFIVGVQWHPEFSYETDENSVKIVKAFTDSMEL